MSGVIRILSSIFLMRAAPQDLPYSRPLLTTLIGVHTFLGIAVAAIYYFPVQDGIRVAVFASAARSALLIVEVGLALAVASLGARFNQTLAALLGLGIICDLMGIPLSLWFLAAAHAQIGVDIPILLSLLIVIWQLIVAGHILRHAFSTGYPQGFALATLFFIVSYTVIRGIFPDSTDIPAGA
ncbi:MAG: hypothetical protein AAF493_18815 [Pseudomonadota bacterium]